VTVKSAQSESTRHFAQKHNRCKKLSFERLNRNVIWYDDHE